MVHEKTNARISLSHAIVTTPSGPVRVPWADVLGTAPQLRIDPIARLRWPDAPDELRFGPGLGNSALTRLRGRSIGRRIDDGTLNHFYARTSPPFDALAVLVVSAIALAITIAVMEYGCAQFRASIPAAYDADYEAVMSRVRIAARSGGVTIVALAAVVFAAGKYLRSGRQPLAIRIDACRAIVTFDDGSAEIHEWRSVLGKYTRPWPWPWSPPPELRMLRSLAASRLGGFGADNSIERALRKRWVAAPRRLTLLSQDRGILLGLVLLNAFFAALWACVIFFGSLPRKPGSDRVPLTPYGVAGISAVVVGSCVVFSAAVVAYDAGSHRLRLRFSQALRATLRGESA